MGLINDLRSARTKAKNRGDLAAVEFYSAQISEARANKQRTGFRFNRQTSYTVRRGDSPASIAKALLGSERAMFDLFAANPDIFRRDDNTGVYSTVIHAGQTLTIPGGRVGNANVPTSARFREVGPEGESIVSFGLTAGSEVRDGVSAGLTGIDQNLTPFQQAELEFINKSRIQAFESGVAVPGDPEKVSRGRPGTPTGIAQDTAFRAAEAERAAALSAGRNAALTTPGAVPGFGATNIPGQIDAPFQQPIAPKQDILPGLEDFDFAGIDTSFLDDVGPIIKPGVGNIGPIGPTRGVPPPTPASIAAEAIKVAAPTVTPQTDAAALAAMTPEQRLVSENFENGDFEDSYDEEFANEHFGAETMKSAHFVLVNGRYISTVSGVGTDGRAEVTGTGSFFIPTFGFQIPGRNYRNSRKAPKLGRGSERRGGGAFVNTSFRFGF